MPQEEFIIQTYCFVDDYLQKMNISQMRTKGESPSLSDSEVITLEIVGEYFGYGSDKAIWSYFKNHWHHYFPHLPVVRVFHANAPTVMNSKRNCRKVFLRVYRKTKIYISAMVFLFLYVIPNVTNTLKRS